MGLELVIGTTIWGTSGALVRDGRLVQLEIVDRAPATGPSPGGAAAGARGALHLGRVRRVDRALGAVFVDCGLDRDGFLERRAARGIGPIERLAEGRPLLVQITRAAEGDKGARLTTDVALLGLRLLHRPGRTGVGLSERLTRRSGPGHGATREGLAALRARAARALPEGGFVLRTTALGASDDQLAEEGRRLRAEWAALQARLADLRAPACLRAEPDPEAAILIELAEPGLERIVVGTAAAMLRARRHLERWAPALAPRLEHHPDAFGVTGVDEQLAAALERVVPLEGGGRLIIQPTAALTAIDVDGGGRRAIDANLEAASEVARQLRLRQIGGTVVVDFIDLADERAATRLLTALRDAVADDPSPVQVLPATPLGLVQISRRRTGPSLAERLGRTCPLCDGEGTVAQRGHAGETVERAGRPDTVSLAL